MQLETKVNIEPVVLADDRRDQSPKLVRPWMVLGISLIALSTSGCLPTAPMPQDPPQNVKPMAAVPFLQYSGQEWMRLTESPANYPVNATYSPLSELLELGSETIIANSVTFLAICDRRVVDTVIGKLADYGKQRSRQARGPLGQSNVQIDTLSAALNTYKNAQSECGFDYSNEISQLQRSYDQAFENQNTLSAQPQSNVRIGDVTALINGLTSVVTAVHGGSNTGPTDCIDCTN
ncbi:MAG: hypothetical protein AAF386_06710 [Pseudomonadota bacterium]